MAFNIRLFGDNPTNRTIATSVSGAGSPTDEIFGPGSPSLTFTGTVSSTSGSPTITGSGTQFTTQVQVGQMFFGYQAGVPRLLGIVTAIASNTSLTLGNNSPLTLSAVDYGSVNKINPVRKPILMRVDVQVSGDLYTVPCPRLLRQGNTDQTSAFTDIDYLFLAQISASGSPGVETSPTVVNTTIQRLNQIPSSGGSNPVVAYSSPPQYFWYLIGADVSSNILTDQLASDASFEVFVETDLPSSVIENNETPIADGLSNTTDNSGGNY